MKLGVSIGVSVLALAIAGPSLHADDKVPASMTVAFGAGLNTAQPGNTPQSPHRPAASETRRAQPSDRPRGSAGPVITARIRWRC